MAGTIRGILSAGILLLSVTTADAQYAGSVRGVVHDHAGQPVAGAVVTLSHPAAPGVRVAMTDLQGEYAIHGLDPGAAYVVHVTLPGFRKYKLSAQAQATVQNVTTVRLKPRKTLLVAR